ncbi:MAG: FAD-dependent thymidylate synthase, partial [Cyanobacteria bacterium J06638_38]
SNEALASFERSSAELNDKDIKLINYLIKHQHTSPFRGVVFKFKVKAPLYICRQWWKHVIASNHNDEQLGWNEKSFRYVAIDDSNEFYIPPTFRQQSKNNKQATIGSLEEDLNQQAIAIYREQCENSYQAYSQLLQLGVGREQARGVLIPSVYTSWVWTVSLQALLNFISLRLGAGAQSEIGAYAQAIVELIEPIVPVSMAAWSKHNGKMS